MRCNNCGRDVSEGEGRYAAGRGFLCIHCLSTFNMQVCSECGQLFPFSELIEFQGSLYCRDDYKNLVTIIESYKPKPKPRGPPMRGGAAARALPRPQSVKKEKIPYETLSNEIHKAARPTETERKEEDKTPRSPEEEKKAMSDMLKELDYDRSKMSKSDEDEALKILKELKDSTKKKKD